MPAQTDTLLRYRPWRGTLHGPGWAALAMARTSLRLMFRRRLYWGLFALSLLVFFFFFYGQYLVVWIGTQLGLGSVDGFNLMSFLLAVLGAIILLFIYRLIKARA